METAGQWCDNASCPDCGKIGADNIKMHSYAERRFRCTTCQRTFSADKGTFFETLCTPRPILLDAVAMLVERNSLRAVSRIKHCTADAVLHWLDLAGQQGAAVRCLVASRSTRRMWSVTISPRARVSGAWCVKLCRIRKTALSYGAISPLRMPSSILYARIKRCASPCHNPHWGANGSNEPRRWQPSSQTISGVSKNYFRIASLLPRTKTSFTA